LPKVAVKRCPVETKKWPNEEHDKGYIAHEEFKECFADGREKRDDIEKKRCERCA